MKINLGCLFLLVGACPCLADGASAFQYSKEVRAHPLVREELVSVPLDSEVYAAASNSLSDLRVLDSSGAAVAFLRRQQSVTVPRTDRQTWSARGPTIQPLPAGGLEIRVRLEERDPQPTGLTIVTPLHDFEQRVSVYGEAGERPLISDARIFDYSQYMDVHQFDVRLPPSRHRQFRIVVEALTSAQQSPLLELSRKIRGGKEEERHERTVVERRPFRIDCVEFFAETVHQSVRSLLERNYEVVEFKSVVETKRHRTVIEVRTRREPLVGFVLKTTSRNFGRRATVQVPADSGMRDGWRRSDRELSRFQLQDLKQEELSLHFAETRSEGYRITIDDRDSPALDIEGVTARGHVDELAFLAASTDKYHLAYGSEEARLPDYDTAALRAALEGGLQPVAAGLGPQNVLAVEPQPLNLQRLLNNSTFLTGLIAVLVAVLGWCLYRTSRRIESLPPEN